MPENKVLKTLEKYRVKNEEVPIIVEGKNDVGSLRKIEFPGDIIILNGGNSLVNFSENVAKENDEVIILTDFDRKGVTLKKTIQKYMIGLGCQVDTQLWDTIRRYGNIRTIEELPFAINKIQAETEVKVQKRITSRRKRDYLRPPD